MLLAGYGMLLALRRGPPASTDVTSSVPPLAELQLPTRLPHRASFEPASTPALIAGAPQDTDLTLTFEEPGALLAALQSGDAAGPASGTEATTGHAAGIAVFTADTQARLHWLPLPRVSGDRAPSWTFRVPQHSPLLVTLAPSEAAALRGYWLRLPVAALHGPAAVAVPSALQLVELDIQFQGGAPTTYTFRLRRHDDPSWHQSRTWQPTTKEAAAGALQCWLGPGDYEIAPLGEAGIEPQRFSVPGAARVPIRFVRPAAAGDRR